MFKSYKKFILFSLLAPLPFIFILFALLYIRDPFWFFHKPYFREESFMRDMRMQAKGIILYKEFDSIIMGTSMLENTSAKEASEKLGNKWMNLSMSGSRFAERFVVLNYIFNHKNIKNIIYSLDAMHLNTKKNTNNSFVKVYNNNAFDDFSIYLSKKFIICALTFSSKEDCIGVKDLDTLVNWHERNKSKFGGIENWDNKILNNKNLKENILQAEEIRFFDTDILELKNYTEKYLLNLIEANPNMNFHLIIPTYSRMAYKIYHTYNTNGELFSNYYALISFIVKKTSKYPNVKIYGFDNLNYADDITNYKDPIHYNIDMNSIQLDAIKNGTHILTPQNMDKYFKTMEEKIRSYDLTPFVEYIKKQET
ncbi:hypothetical protein ACXAIF_000344 [Campylobacter coli]|nr:hypothetical protein [Campylobacter coli]